MAARRSKPKAADGQQAAQALVDVAPAANYQIGHEGVVVGPGERITVPADVAERWRAQGLVE